MKILDKIVLNRLIAIITGFILAIVKIFKPKDSIINPNEPIPPLRNKPLRKKLKELKDKIIP